MRVKLVVVRGQSQGREEFPFPEGEFIIGRGNECHVRPDSSWVSRQHCLLRVTDHSVSLQDLGSTNGTLVNGQRILGERDLSSGDQIQIGQLQFCLLIEEMKSAKDQLTDTGLHSAVDTAETRALSDKAFESTKEIRSSQYLTSS